MRKLLALLLALVMALGLVACGGKTEPAAEATSSAETTAEQSAAETSAKDTSAEEATLNLQWHQGIGIDTVFENPWKDLQSMVPYMLFDSLLAQNADGTYVNRLASDYTVSDDGLTYTFTIREGAKWHDGTDVTIDDVIWSLNACDGMASPYATPLACIEGYADVQSGAAKEMSGIVADGNVMTLKLTKPSRALLYGLCVIKILPKHLLGEVAYTDLTTYEPFWSNPIGCGPYKLESVSFPDYCTLVANPDYYGTAPGIQKCLFTNYSAGGNDAVVAALISGNLDFAWKNALNDIEVANNITAQNSDMVAQLATSFYERYFQFNNKGRADGETKTDLAKAEVRQAFDLILDKNAIASFYEGQGVALSTFVNPASSKYNDDIPLPQQDIDTAVAMLKEADFDFTKTYDIAYYYDDQTTSDVMELIKQDFAKAGITVEGHLLTGDLQTQLNVDSNFDLCYAGVSGVVDPINIYEKLVSTNTALLGQQEERAAVIDAAFDAYNASGDEATAKETGDQLQVLGYQNAWILPAYGLNSVYLYNKTKLSVPAEIFELDNETGRNWMLESWALN
ncbi:MAG: ABC transporter substrate-binding protein [Oscillospiraceae bacterium]|nr:ABC transporter substrate-binding protein [Oscillospiraceae bacterium]